MAEAETTKKAIPELSTESRLLIQKLRDLEPGGFVSYDELAKHAALPSVRSGSKGVGHLTTARRRILRDYGALLLPVKNLGLKRARAEDMPDVGRSLVRAVHRASERGARALSTTDLDALNPDQKTAVLSQASALSFLKHYSREKEVKKLQPYVTTQTLELPVGKVLQAFEKDRAEPEKEAVS